MIPVGISRIPPQRLVAPPKKVAVGLLNMNDMMIGKTSDGGTVIQSKTNSLDSANGAYLANRYITTQSSYSGCYGSSSQIVDFRMTGSGAGVQLNTLSSYDLELGIQNTDGANALRILPTPYHFSRIELVIKGEVVDSYTTGRQTEMSILRRMPQREFQSVYPMLGYVDTAFTTTGVTIAAATIQYFRLPIKYLFPWLSKPILQGISAEIIFRFHFNPGNSVYYSTSASTGITLSSARVLLTGHILDADSQSLLIKASRSSTTYIPAMYSMYRSNNFGAIAANGTISRYTMQQDGWMAGVFIDLVDNATTTEDQITNLVGFQQYHLYDSNGQQINVQNVTSNEVYSNNAMIWGKSVPSSIFPVTVAIGTVTGASALRYPDAGPAQYFCDDYYNIFANINRYGSMKFNGQEQFDVQMGSGGATNLVINFYFDMLAIVTQWPGGDIDYGLYKS